MNISKTITILVLILVVSACNSNKEQNAIEGTWRLVSATSTEKDSTFSTFNPKNKMIKIINASHFAFFNHDLNNGKDSTTAAFSGGGGTYTLKDSVYKEKLNNKNNRQ